jgi:hypothetical protein
MCAEIAKARHAPVRRERLTAAGSDTLDCLVGRASRDPEVSTS